MSGLCAPLSTLRRHPRGYRRMTRGQCGSLDLHCKRLALSTPCRSSRRTDILVCIDGTAAGHVRFDDETFAAIERAYYDHAVIFFRDQHITPRQQVAFTRRFGEIEFNIFGERWSVP